MICKIPQVLPNAPSRIKTLRTESFVIKGPRIFNSLPQEIRSFTGGTFKSRLDAYLKTVPDEPLIPGYTAARRVESNSLIDWANYLSLDNEGARGLQQAQHATRADQPDSP